MNKNFAVLSVLISASLVLSACGAPATPVGTEPSETTALTEAPATEPPAPEFTAPQGALVAFPANATPTLDGVADDAAWADAQEVVIPVASGFNNFSTDVSLKAVYTSDSVYFLVSYADPSESWFRSPWQKQEDGTWKKITDPNDKGGDNNTVYEDKFAMIWPIDNSIKNFQNDGCFVACHAGENPDAKPFGNKYTSSKGELGDIWHWKSVRNDGQVDDQYLDATRYSVDTPEAGRHSDTKESGGYADNVNEDKTGPAFTSPNVDLTTGAPGFILDSEKVALDQAASDEIPTGSFVPGIVKSSFVADRGDISAAWTWENGVWNVELSRALASGSETDVQFFDLAATYYFGVAVFENAQVRHAFQTGSTPFVFMPKP